MELKTKMKIKVLLLLLIIPLFIGMSCTSHSESEDDIIPGSIENGITGTWKVVNVDVHTDNVNGYFNIKPFNNPIFKNAVITFSKDGTFINHTSGETSKWEKSEGDEKIFMLDNHIYKYFVKNQIPYLHLEIGGNQVDYKLESTSIIESIIDEPKEISHDKWWPYTTIHKPSKIVDLGVSVLWASKNLDASNSYPMGNRYYTFGGANPTTPTMFSDMCGTALDHARDYLGEYWRLPTKEEAQELIEKCKWEKNNLGYKVTGPNGNSIELTGQYIETGTLIKEDLRMGGYVINNGKVTELIEWTRTNVNLVDWKQKEFTIYIHPVYQEKVSNITAAKEVDLGLSVIWSGYNLGATDVTSSGIKASWGIGDYYVEIPQQGISGTDADRVRHIMGMGWRYPTKAEAEELLTKCKWELVSINKINGYKITGPNGKAIFMPYVPSGDSKNPFFQYWVSDGAKTGSYLTENGRVSYHGMANILPVRPVKSK